jgi:hypothetical protein
MPAAPYIIIPQSNLSFLYDLIKYAQNFSLLDESDMFFFFYASSDFC